MKKVSLSDIAKSLGVSTTLVSLVLNNKGDDNGINEETQKKVFRKAEELNYKPNPFARGLRIGKSETIGLIVSDISNTFYSRIAGKIERIASQYGYNLFVCSSDEDPQKETELINMLKEKQVDGLIISSTLHNTKEIQKLKKENYPFVLIDRQLPLNDLNSISINNHAAALQGVEHFVKNKIEKIAFFSISPSHISTMKERVNGFKEGLKNNQIKFKRNLLVEIDFNNIEAATDRAINDLLSTEHNIRGIFTGNNSIAIACMKALDKRNLRIPHDIALLSFDDIDLFQLSFPKITSIKQPVEQIGEKAVELLLNEIKLNGKAPKKQITLDAKLIERHSCGELLIQNNY